MFMVKVHVIPLLLTRKLAVCRYLRKIMTLDNNCIVRNVFDQIRQLNIGWYKQLRDLLNDVGLYGIDVEDIVQDGFVVFVESRLKNDFVQKWKMEQANSVRGITYSFLRPSFAVSNFISANLTYSEKLTCLRFISSNHSLPIEVEKWRGVPRNERFCPFCPQSLGDEFHYLLECEHFSADRTGSVPRYYISPTQSMLKFTQLLSTTDNRVLKKLSHFMRTIMTSFQVFYCD